MAQVNVDLSEYDMLRTSKDKAEAEVKELKEEIKKLKDNASNVVVKNRYYIASLNYNKAANNIVRNLGVSGIEQLLIDIQRRNDRLQFGMLDTPQLDRNLIRNFAFVLENGLKEFLNLRSSYVEDAVITEIKGFDEISESVRAKLESEYKDVMEQKKADLDRQLEVYNAKHLEVEEEVKKAEDKLQKRHEKEVKELEGKIDSREETIKDLKEQLKEASKTSEEKLAEARTKLQEAQEEVAKYTKSRKKLFGIFG